jgi:hypothetical protein
MLVKNESEYCWYFDGDVGDPQGSIEEAINDFLNYYRHYCWDEKNDVEYLEQDVLDDYVEIGHPYYYVPEIDSERVIWNVCDYDLDDEIAEWSDDYMKDVKNEHIDELSKELTKVFQAWEKRHGYENRVWVVQETKAYRIGDYIDSDGNYK